MSTPFQEQKGELEMSSVIIIGAIITLGFGWMIVKAVEDEREWETLTEEYKKIETQKSDYTPDFLTWNGNDKI